MLTLATTVDGLKLPNPFIIGSGPPGTNLNVISRAFKEGWGAVIAKTVSLDASKVINVTPRYGKLMANDGKEVVGWENIELISDRPFKLWEEEFKKCKQMHPEGVLIATFHGRTSIATYRKTGTLKPGLADQIEDECRRLGWGYQPYRAHENVEWGFSMTSAARLAEIGASVPGMRIAGIREAGWGNNHDVLTLINRQRLAA